MSSKGDGRGGIDYKRRNFLKTIPLAGIVGIGSGTVIADSGENPAGTATSAKGTGKTFPEVIPVPDGFRPEGIVTGRGHAFFVGSLAAGAVYRGDLRTGDGEVLVPPTGRVAVGLSHDRRSNHLFVAGGPTGTASVYDSKTGETAAVYDLAGPGSFVNDVVVTESAAYFTDSFRPVLYRVPLGPAGRLPDQSTIEEIPLGGDFESIPGAFNANGIDAPPNGEYLIVVNSTAGKLYSVDPASGSASLIDLGGETVTAGDGILLDGRTLYVVRNRFNRIAVVRLDPGAARGEIVREITDSRFDVPTTIAEFGNALYAVNARFGVDDPGNASYDVVRVPKRSKP